MQPRQTYSSLADRVQAADLGEHVVSIAFLGGVPFHALADGRIASGSGGTRQAHEGGILVAAASGDLLLTGGDDGRVVATRADLSTEEIAAHPGRWIDAVAIGPGGVPAWSTGRTVHVRGNGAGRTLEVPSTARGLVFAPKGLRLAAAHIDGATLWFPNTDATPERLTWKGPHIDVTWSRDGRFLVTSMQDNQLHGWRLADRNHMRMSGYPGKTRSFSWSHDGNWLATSGAEAAIVWPFVKDGPTGKAPRECGVRPARVSQVAFHPGALVLAIGYEDGWVLLVRLTDAAEILVRQAEGGAVSALAWSPDGRQLAFGTADGSVGLLPLPS